jgi:hypothetical protein
MLAPMAISPQSHDIVCRLFAASGAALTGDGLPENFLHYQAEQAEQAGRA